MLYISNLNQYFDQSHILWNINLDIPKGSRSSLIGRNGVGKSTLLRSLMGLIPIQSGQIYFNNHSITHSQAWERNSLGISYVPQGRGILGKLTVEENLQIAVKGKTSDNFLAEVFDYFPDLKTFLHRKASFLSGGQQQQLAIARALLQQPKLLILDEPTEGIQPNIVDQIGEVLVYLNKSRNLTILTIEQKVSFVKAYHNYFNIMDKGRIVCNGPMEELSSEHMTQYLQV